MSDKLFPLLIFGAALGIALAIRQILVLYLDRKASGRLTFLFVFLQAIRLPSVLWCFAIALAVALRYAPLSPPSVALISKWIVAFIIVSASLAAAAILERTIAVYGERHRMPFAVAGLSKTLIDVFVLGIGALILLRHFSISITPLLTALGVGGLAVALALQDTLANFFAGVHILVEAPINVGDFIKLSTGEEGVVSDIGWRTTRVLTGGHSMTVIPNTKITSSILTNFSIPDSRVTADIAILAGLDANPHEVAQIAIDVAAATEGTLADPPPLVLFDPGVMQTHMQLKLLVSIPNPALRGPVQSAIRVALLERFRERFIPLPDPRRMV